MISDEQILKAHILIIDDNMLNVQILKKILTDVGFYNIHFTTDPTQAFALDLEFAPDLILLDINMPQMNGFEVMAKFKEIHPNDYIPILVLTSEESQEVRFKALQSGAKDFLKKPYDRLEVVLRSRNIIEVRLLYNQTKQENQSLEGVVASQTQDLKKTRLDVVERLARAAEFRDAETGQHIMRMSHYAAALSKAVGFSQEQCELILTTSPLHDIGKIAIPDHILNKPGKLDPQEYELMKTHAAIGAQLLSGSDSVFLNMAQTIALTHHEKWDGTGYPHGLAGEAIPLTGRICALSDVFDALTSKRPYKEAWSVEQAFEEVKKSSGKHFDPALVQAFLDIAPEIVLIHQKYH